MVNTKNSLNIYKGNERRSHGFIRRVIEHVKIARIWISNFGMNVIDVVENEE